MQTLKFPLLLLLFNDTMYDWVYYIFKKITGEKLFKILEWK